jgi:non-heme chloroperoxidase
VDGSVFDDIMQRLAADRLAYLSAFFQAFYNLDVFLGQRISDEAVRDSWNVASRASAKGTAACVQAWLTDFRKDLPRIEVPSLIIQGDADRILPIDATGRRLEKSLKASRLIAIKGAPHGLLWTHAAELNPVLLEFVRSEQTVGATGGA